MYNIKFNLKIHITHSTHIHTYICTRMHTYIHSTHNLETRLITPLCRGWSVPVHCLGSQTRLFRKENTSPDIHILLCFSSLGDRVWTSVRIHTQGNITGCCVCRLTGAGTPFAPQNTKQICIMFQCVISASFLQNVAQWSPRLMAIDTSRLYNFFRNNS